MMVVNRSIQFNTRGHCDMINITPQVAEQITSADVKDGIATLFVIGSTAGITTIEFEPGLIDDFQNMWERVAPQNTPYHHDRAWGDGNGHAHIRASLLGPSITIPFVNKIMSLGTWQQIVVLDFDNRPRSREINLQLLGE